MPSFQQILALANDARTRIREIPPATAVDPEHRGRRLLDVRERSEFDAAHLPGARHLSWLQLEARIGELIPDRSTPILTYCAIGHRSAIAADMLQQLGYRDVVSLEGGLQAFQADAVAQKAA
jgi:rhodanese-related sulfurtransferase